MHRYRYATPYPTLTCPTCSILPPFQTLPVQHKLHGRSAHLKSTLVMCLCPPRRYRSEEKSELPHPITSTRSSRLTTGVTYSAKSLYEPYLAGGDNRWEW